MVLIPQWFGTEVTPTAGVGGGGGGIPSNPHSKRSCQLNLRCIINEWRTYCILTFWMLMLMTNYVYMCVTELAYRAVTEGRCLWFSHIVCTHREPLQTQLVKSHLSAVDGKIMEAKILQLLSAQLQTGVSIMLYKRKVAILENYSPFRGWNCSSM